MTESDWHSGEVLPPMLEFSHANLSDRKLRLFAAACCRRIWQMLHFPAGRSAVEIAELLADGAASETHRRAAFDAAAREAADWVNNCSVEANAIGYATGAATFVIASEDTVEAEAAEVGARDVVEIAHACHASVGWPGPAMISALDCSAAMGCAVVAFLDEAERIADGEHEERPIEVQRTFDAGSVFARSLGFDRTEAAPLDRTAAGELAACAESKIQCDLARCIFGNPFRKTLFERSWLTDDVTSLARTAYDGRSLPCGVIDRAVLGVLADALEDARCGDADILEHLRGDGTHVRGCWVLDLLTGRS